VDKYSEQGFSAELGKLFAEKELMAIKVKTLEKELATREARSIEIDQEIAALRTEYGTNLSRIAELKHEQEQLKAEWNDLSNKADALKIEQTRLAIDYDAAYEAAVAHYNKEQIETVQATTMATDIKLNTDINASRHTEARQLVKKMGTDAFWENNVTDKAGNVVYHDHMGDNPEQPFYHLVTDKNGELVLDEETGDPMRLYYNDPNEILDMVKQSKTASFGNESRFQNNDTANTMMDTFRASLSNKNKIATVEHAVETQIGQEEDAHEDAHIAYHKSAASKSDPAGEIKAHECKKPFNAASAPLHTPIPAPDHDHDLTAQDGQSFINVAP